MRISEKDKLCVHWGRDEYGGKMDLIVSWPTMVQGSADGSWLFSHVFTRENVEELKRRGYDITTLKFSIAPKLENPTRPERFRSLIEKYSKKQ